MKEEEIYIIAAELLTKIDSSASTANEIVNSYTKKHKYIEAEERKLLLDLIWGAIRVKARLNYVYPNSDWLFKLKQMKENGIPDSKDMPLPVRLEVQEWFLNHLPDPEPELEAMLQPAPIVLRANGDRNDILKMLQAEGLEVTACEHSPLGIILKEYANLKESKTFKKGLIEIQDEGAQLLSLATGIKPNDDVFDFCAGAGGKSLIFAQMMQNRGFIQAYDASYKRLSELSKRAWRANVSIIKPVFKLPPPHKKFDYVVVDAPCTGTGTWRRSPDLRWTLSERQLYNITQKQAEILSVAQEYVKNGHFLVYITCSLTYDENENQVTDFIKNFPSFHVVETNRYSPWRTNTDGFFMCILQKR